MASCRRVWGKVCTTKITTFVLHSDSLESAIETWRHPRGYDLLNFVPADMFTGRALAHPDNS